MRLTTFALVAVSAFSSFAAAQSTSTSSASASAMSTVSDPSSVALGDRTSWCRAQLQSCPTLCGGSTSSNTCDINTLAYNCTCDPVISNFNVSAFEQTLPSLECQYAVAQCVTNHPDDSEGQKVCQSVVCGDKKVESQVSASSSSSASASASATRTAASSGSATGSSAAATTTAASAGIAMAKTYGSGALIAGLLAVFGFAL